MDLVGAIEKELEARRVLVELNRYATSDILVYSKDLEWVPQGNQKKTIKKVSLVYGNILIAKLR